MSVNKRGHVNDVKICDLGLACYFDKDTKLKSRVGTHGFMSPELILSQNYNESVDSYSLGVTLFYMV